MLAIVHRVVAWAHHHAHAHTVHQSSTVAELVLVTIAAEATRRKH